MVHPRIEDVIRTGQFPASAGPEVVIRTSAATGETLVLVDGATEGIVVSDDVQVISRSEIADGAHASITEHAGGHSWRVSAESFFQAGPGIASALVDAVNAVVGDLSGRRMVDAYCGVGLFAGTVGRAADAVVAIEVSSSSIRDAAVNLGQQRLDGQAIEVIESTVESWVPTAADVVVADPARAGLGAGGVRVLSQANAQRFVLISCDTGSFGRDAGLLRDAGYRLESVQLVDAFRDTSHVETIAAFAVHE